MDRIRLMSLISDKNRVIC